MKIIAMSDTHGQHKELTLQLLALYQSFPNAILIHAGDACMSGNKNEGYAFLEWFSELPFKTKIFVPGNHDVAFEFSYHKLDYLELHEYANSKNIIVGINDFVEICGIKFLFSNHIPFLKNWAFYSDDDQRKRFFEVVPQNPDIIVSHNPPYGIGDQAPRGIGTFEHVGCKFLRNYIDKNNPKLVINGHIHEGYGVGHYKDIPVFNVSMLDGYYRGFNPITVIDY